MKKQCKKCRAGRCHFCGRTPDNRGMRVFTIRDPEIAHYICPSCAD